MGVLEDKFMANRNNPHEDSDYDSQDSNREDHDQNEYPDEESDHEMSNDDTNGVSKPKKYVEDEEETAIKKH